MELTDAQKAIVEQDGNCVVLAAPGSGKTFVISEKIKRILRGNLLREYQGVIAISYTRKAAKNLKDRVFNNIPFSRTSFFGTIDGFCFSEIVSPFLPHIWSKASTELDVKSLADYDNEFQEENKWIKDKKGLAALTDTEWNFLKGLYDDEDYVLVETLELLACFVLEKSKACLSYLKARYKYIFIDEYQDADLYTSILFDKLIQLGLVAIAVGDVKQSIFGYDKKDCKYLQALVDRPDFHHFELDKNFRCSPSIVNYSSRLMESKSELLPAKQCDVHLVRIKGTEAGIGEFLSGYIKDCCKLYHVEKMSNVAILARNNKFLKVIANNLSLPYRLFDTTGLDKDSNLRSALYAGILRFYFDSDTTFLDVVEDYADFESFTRYEKKRLLQLKNQLVEMKIEVDKDTILGCCKNMADIILPKVPEGSSFEILEKVLSDEKLLESYKPIRDVQVNLMTLHKSKGLEFDLVFHLNLHEWVFPSKHPVNGDFKHPKYASWQQDLDLHYVGITRAKKACYFIVPAQRTNSYDRVLVARDSEFLYHNNVQVLRDVVDLR